jgi:hypothetical protein
VIQVGPEQEKFLKYWEDKLGPALQGS